ncbi:hypothetical protein LFYK43_10900 [Ligilactobacillus salitolerans]|uniref:Uncharacterized protein n=1 Tax=Ligilactobacillus salitolerans TaxID=1808352 RepID=A0A401ISY2_9LACO|nr:hypothetical protein [Ligilactobacillus salitolerans]GBG94631.1 hypothetical protein LFYK43_10900 [Ligilactobacillus salitolerans]
MCKFCDGKSLDLSGLTDEQVEYGDMAFCYILPPYNGKPFRLEYGSYGDGYDGQASQTEIKFCPMCGHSLEVKS